MKIIFLDIDGVLNSDEYITKAIQQKITGIESQIDIEKIKLLKHAIELTGAKVVLTSSWRYTIMAQELRQLLLKYKIPTECTPLLENERGKEIKQWLSTNKNVDNFVIIDDEVFESYDEQLIAKLIKISNGNGISLGEGLQEKDVYEIVKRLGREIDLER